MKGNKKQHEEEPSLTREYPETSETSTGAPDTQPTLRSLLTQNDVVFTIINYAFLAFTEQSFCVLMPLMFATSVAYGGLGFDAMTIGIILSTMGIGFGCSSILLFPVLSRKLGYRKLYRLAYCTTFILLLAFPVMNFFARRGNYTVVYAVVGCYVACWLILLLCYSE